MATGFRGTFVISWTQTELDGLASAPLRDLRMGTAWRWTGEAVRVDGPAQVLRLGAAEGEIELRARAGRGARRLTGWAGPAPAPVAEPSAAEASFAAGFSVTDGNRVWPLSLVETGEGHHPLLMIRDDLPPRDAELWVVAHNVRTVSQEQPAEAVVCFTPGTRIACEHGEVPVEELRPGDRIQTRDNGCQPLVWLGRRHVSGARLRAMPGLAPVRLTPGALDGSVPVDSLLVSPGHRILLRGARAQALWNEPEVLVRAADLLGHDGVYVDRTVRDVTYLHLYLPGHEVVFANGTEADSFHPAFADLDQLSPRARAELAAVDPDVAACPGLYGAPARRMLSHGDAQVLFTH